MSQKLSALSGSYLKPPALPGDNYYCECLIYELIALWKKYCPPDLETTTADTTESAESTNNLAVSCEPAIVNNVMADANTSAETKPTTDSCCRTDTEHATAACHFEMETLRKLLLPNGFDQRKKDEWESLAADKGDKASLKSSRNRGEKTQDGLFGRDTQGNIWAKRDANAKKIYYYCGCESSLIVTT